MSLRDLIAIDFRSQGLRHNPGMTYSIIRTPDEASFVLSAALRVRLHHAVFNSVRISWFIEPGLLDLYLRISMTVHDRNLPSSNPDRVPVLYEQLETEPEYGTAYAQVVHYDPRVVKPIEVQSTVPVTLYDHELRGDPEKLTERLAAFAREEIARVIVHEVDEMLRIDDRQVRDPHVSDSRR